VSEAPARRPIRSARERPRCESRIFHETTAKDERDIEARGETRDETRFL
jgi:hypothetical protein